MTKKTGLTLTVQGRTVNASVISAFAKRIGSIDDVLSVWANAATLQVACHGNRNWIDSLFSMPALKLANGDLSKAGKDVFKYIEAHFPRAVWDKESQKVGFKKLQKDSILATHFVAAGATAEGDNVTEHRGKFYMPHGDFALTLTAFKNLEKPEVEKDEKEVSMTAKAFSKQAEKALACFKDAKFTGTPDELLAAAQHAKALFLAIDAAYNEAQAKKIEAAAAEGGGLDTAMAAQLLQSGQKGKATRAGGKVEATEVAA